MRKLARPAGKQANLGNEAHKGSKASRGRLKDEFTLQDILISMQVGQIMDDISETHDKSSGEPSANQTPVTIAANVDNGQKRNEKRQNKRQHDQSFGQQFKAKKRALEIQNNTEIEDFDQNNSPTNQQIMAALRNVQKKIQQQQTNSMVGLVIKRLDITDERIENLARESNKYTLRVDGIPANSKDTAKAAFDKIVKTCLHLSNITPSDIKEAKFLATKNNKKPMLITFTSMDKKQAVLQACTKLSSNKLEGKHSISISAMFTHAQIQLKNASLATKKACEEYSKEKGGSFVNNNHMKLVGYNRLDDSDKKNPPKMFSEWLQNLVNKEKTDPCHTVKFREAFETAIKLANELETNIKL